MQYCDRTLMASPYSYCLVLSEADYITELKRHKIPLLNAGEWIGDGAQATAHFFTYDSSKRVCIVCLDDSKKIDAVTKVATIVHEAVHIWQYICKFIDEENPSDEFEAYSIQRITYELLLAYDRAKAKQKKKIGLRQPVKLTHKDVPSRKKVLE